MASDVTSQRKSRPITAALASAVVPGIGQFIAGSSRRGIVLILIDISILAGGVGALLQGGYELKEVLLTAATLWIKPSALVAMMIGNIFILGYRVLAATDAYRTAREITLSSNTQVNSSEPPSKFQPQRTEASQNLSALSYIGLAVVALVLFLPHAVFGYYNIIMYDTLLAVFGEDTTTTALTTTPTTAPATSSATEGTSGNTTTTAQTTTTTTEPPASIFTDGERLNILLIGGDFGEGRTGIRTDTLITVSIDPESGEAAMFSVPRNWTQSPLPEGMGIWECNCYPELINELWVMGERYPDAFPGEGTPSENAVKGVISEFLGIEIDHYAMVNLDGFVDIVDALGGVNIYVPSTVIDEEYPHEDGTVERIEIEAGWQELDGHLALAYARTRHQDSDYFRMSRQRCVIEAMVKEADPVSLALNFGSLTDVVKETMLTDIPLDALPQLLELLPAIEIENVVSIRFIPPEYHLKFRDDGEPGRVANIELVHEHVQLVINDPELAIEELGLEQLEDVCGDPNA